MYFPGACYAMWYTEIFWFLCKFYILRHPLKYKWWWNFYIFLNFLNFVHIHAPMNKNRNNILKLKFWSRASYEIEYENIQLILCNFQVLKRSLYHTRRSIFFILSTNVLFLAIDVLVKFEANRYYSFSYIWLKV